MKATAERGAPVMTRVPGVDGMRAVAALAVFVCHLGAYWRLQDQLPANLGPLSELGTHGVDLFVVISGFCLALPVAGRHDLGLNVRNFFVRRLTRIGPPFYVALLACAILAMSQATSHLVVAERADWRDLLAHVFLVQTLIPGEVGTINGSFWSIALEAQLYLTFPLLVIVWRRFGVGTVVIGSAAISLAWWALGYLDGWVLGDDHVIFDRLVQFAIGVWAAQRLVEGRAPDRRLLWYGLIFGGLLACVSSSWNLDFGRSILWAIPAVCALLLAAHRLQQQVIGLPLERLGLVSYSFYLLQQPILLLTAPAAHQLSNSPVVLLLLGCTVCLALTIALSWVMYATVEAPSMRWGGKLTKRKTAQREHATAPVA
jgi:peptidoglycan/LPS O-acetylase OafA/YrhL